jgi:hypothetical protein
MKNFKPFAIAIVALLLFSCQFNSTYLNREEDKDAAEKITNQYFDLGYQRVYAFIIFLYPQVVYNVHAGVPACFCP